MEPENKENLNPSGHKFDQLMDMSVDSLDQACLPEVIDVNKGDIAGDSPTGNSLANILTGENLLPREAQEYADNLVRAIIDDTNQSEYTEDVQSKISEDKDEVNTNQIDNVDIDCRISAESTVVETQRDKESDDQKELAKELQEEENTTVEEVKTAKEEDNQTSEVKEEVEQEVGQEVEQEVEAIKEKVLDVKDNEEDKKVLIEDKEIVEESLYYVPEPEADNNNTPLPNDSPLAFANKNFDAYQTFQTAGCNSLLEDCDKSNEMEFTKNYSDDLLMGQNDAIQGELVSGGADLADFELPPYSGSSSGSEPRQQSPIKRKSSSNSAAQTSISHQVTVSPPNLSAVKRLLTSSYSKVSHVFHWKKPIETAVFFTIGVTIITALTFYSIISVVAYSALGAIMASSLIRIYKTIMNALNRSSDTPFDHIWDKFLSLNVSMSSEKIHEALDASLGNLNSCLVYFKQVLLVEDKIATFKFGIFLYLLTYIGAWFNGMTLITISYLALFSVPMFYEKNKTEIDGYLNLATVQISSTISTITGKVTSVVFGSSPNPTSSGLKKQN